MRKSLKLIGVVFILAVFLASCAPGTVVKKTDVMVVTYESCGMALRTAYTYLSTREANGSLSGADLVTAKTSYTLARGKFLEAGKMLQDALTSPAAFDQAKYQALLDTAAKIAAGLSAPKGGK